MIVAIEAALPDKIGLNQNGNCWYTPRQFV